MIVYLPALELLKIRILEEVLIILNNYSRVLPELLLTPLNFHNGEVDNRHFFYPVAAVVKVTFCLLARHLSSSTAAAGGDE